MSSVKVVVGGWGRDDDGLTVDPGQREKVLAVDANLELLSPQQTWTDLSSVEVVSPSGRGDISRLSSHCCSVLSYAIKPQLKAPKAPY